MEEKTKTLWMVEDAYCGGYTAFDTKERAKEHILKVYLDKCLPKIKEYTNYAGEVITREKQIADDILQWCNENYIEDFMYLYDVEYFPDDEQ